MNMRTDMAAEARRLFQTGAEESGEIPGVTAKQTAHYSIPIEVIEILNRQGAQCMGKPEGNYVSLDISSYFRREPDSFRKTAEAVARVLGTMMGDWQHVLVVGLGNRKITPDVIGPGTVDGILITRHLKKADNRFFASFSTVSAICPGVLGQTGMESAELVCAAVEKIRPDCLVCVDALASCEPDRLCRNVQISDSGIVPGSGVGNHRWALNRELLGIPVYAVGVPTVVDGSTFLMHHTGCESCGVGGDLVLTARDMDARAGEICRLLGYGLNLAFHPELTVDEIHALMS